MIVQTETRKVLEQFMDGLRRRNPGEVEFHQAVQWFAGSVLPVVLEHRQYEADQVLERMTEPDRIVIFRVPWEDGAGKMRASRAWRVQFNGAPGSYQGGLRFDRSVDQSILKLLGFEQCLKNALSGLPIGGSAAGVNFDPKGKSDREVMRFCQSLMIELHRHIGEDIDLPAGDVGVGMRELGYLSEQYRRLSRRVLTADDGPHHERLALEATGYGIVYFAGKMLERLGEGLEHKRCAISGSGKVAIYAAEKAIALGAKVLTLSDSGGTVYDRNGVDEEKLEFVKHLKLWRRGRLAQYAERFGCPYLEGKRPWLVPCDLAFPCATHNELGEEGAKTLIGGGCQAVVEGANMPTSQAAARLLESGGVLFGPAKAAGAGGAAISWHEQGSLRRSSTRAESDRRLSAIMDAIHGQCVEWGTDGAGRVNYARGANLAAFARVADATLSSGVV